MSATRTLIEPRATERTAAGRILFVGAVHEAQPALRALLDIQATVVAVFTLSERLAARTAGAVDLAPTASASGVPVFRTENLNLPEEVERVRALSPDLIVAVGWTRLLGAELLGIPARGCVGFHASLLPRHRGRAPVNWAIIRGDAVTGNTMMFLEEGVDAGDIIDQRPVIIEPDDTCATVYTKVAAAGALMLRTHLPALLAGEAPRRPQDHDGADLLPKRTPEMGVTDWDRPARAVHDWIRALTHPYPGAFSHIDDRKLFIWRSAVPDAGGAEAPPGTILGIEGQAIRVATSDGSLRVLRMQEEGAPEESAVSWYRRQGPATERRFRPVDAATSQWALGFQGGREPAGEPAERRGPT